MGGGCSKGGQESSLAIDPVTALESTLGALIFSSGEWDK